MEPCIGEIRMFAGNYPPAGWFFCNGGELAISQYTPLYTIIGTRYGGNGTDSFKLPNIVTGVIGADMDYQLGTTCGDHFVEFGLDHIPPHSHFINGRMAVSTVTADKNDPTGNYFAVTGVADKEYAKTAGFGVYMAGDMLELELGNVVRDESKIKLSDFLLGNLQPYLCVHYIICAEGEFPKRP